MATVRITYFGMDGAGSTVTEAKKDAGRKIEAALDGSYAPSIIDHRGYSVLVYREPMGWCDKLIRCPEGMRTGRQYASANHATEKDALRAACRHVAQLGWTEADGQEPPVFLTDRADIAEYKAWTRFQLRYQAARRAGLEGNDAHSFAGCDPSRPELQDRVPAEYLAGIAA
jgi:hypothetical protein